MTAPSRIRLPNRRNAEIFYTGLETPAAVRHFDKTILELRKASSMERYKRAPQNRSEQVGTEAASCSAFSTWIRITRQAKCRFPAGRIRVSQARVSQRATPEINVALVSSRSAELCSTSGPIQQSIRPAASSLRGETEQSGTQQRD
jgi:hypothetical protein